VSLTSTYQQDLMDTFGLPARVMVKGSGVHLWDEDGCEYLDLLAGIACVGLGHAAPGVTAALTDQAERLGHVSNFFATPPQVELADRLIGLLGQPAKVFLSNSGTEANEAAFKLTRLSGRTKIVAAENAFHGRTMGSLALTAKTAYRQPFEPLPGQVKWVPYGDAEALAAAVDDQTAAVVLEPIQGEAGVIVPPVGYLQAARTITRRHGALLWLDEVQSGMGRTGDWFAHSAERVIPDIVTLAKALGNGFPIGATLATGAVADWFKPGSHGSTFGGNALASAVALAVIDGLEPLLPHVKQTGDWLMSQLSDLAGVAEVRGRGLFIGISLEEPCAAALVKAGLNHGLIINAPRPDIIRLVPPLIIERSDLSILIDRWPTLWKQATHG
jgi:acetylornithine aminotransferase